MFQIDDKIISDDIFEVKFACDLNACKGWCCVEGDAGAPLTEDEALILDEIFPKIKQYLPDKALKTIEKKGLYEYDEDGDLVTTTVNDKECVFAYFDNNGIVKCAIEKAYFDGVVDFRKPISCHLYPIRLKNYEEFVAINYDKQEICNVALIKGKKENIPLFKFLKEPLIRKFGEEFYSGLEKIYIEFFREGE